MNDTTSLLTAIAPPALLLGFVLFMSRPRGLEGLDQEQLPPPRPTGRNGIATHQRRRHAARKLYGSAVLTAQAAGSMKTLALRLNDRGIAQHALNIQRSSNELMRRASQADAGFIRSKMERRA
jgi:hypothetical protein